MKARNSGPSKGSWGGYGKHKYKMSVDNNIGNGSGKNYSGLLVGILVVIVSLFIIIFL